MSKDTAPTTDSAAIPAAPPAAAAPVAMLYEVTCAGPLKIGGVLAWRTARLPVYPATAEAINAAQPGSLMFLGEA